MRLAGNIRDWNDARGFGFVAPHGGGPRAFVHIRAFQSGSRRPLDGDLISYEAVADAKGRLNAARVRFAGQKSERPQRRPGRSRVPRRGIAVGFLIALAAVVVLGRVPIVLGLGYLGLSLVSWILYCVDKDAAGKRAWRTPESTLHLVDLLGGWPGGLLAQQQFRHKTAKVSFQATFWFTVLVNVAVVGWFVWNGTAADFASVVSGR